MEQWAQTCDTREAAAFGTMGVPVRLKTTLEEDRGQRVTRFFLGLRSVDGRVVTNDIQRRWKNGQLEAKEPGHPFLTILRGMTNRLRLLDLTEKGVLCTLHEVPGTGGIYQYVRSGEGLAGISGQKALLSTGDLKMAAALGVTGLPVLKIEGPKGRRKYFLPRFLPARGGRPAVDGQALMQAWRADKESIPWEHPFAQAARGLHNRERFLDAINRDTELVLLRKPRSWKAAVIRADAGPKAWDRVKDHFDQ